jgi:hypothetical protein
MNPTSPSASCHPGQRRHDDRQHAPVTSVQLALAKLIEIDTEQAGEQFDPGELPAVLAGT